MMRRMFAGLLLFVSATAFAGTSNALYYRGVMLGEDGKPVSGVFPMTFSLYKTKKSRRAVWKERMWVAVDEGGYIVRLGERKPLHLGKLNNLWIGIRIKGMGEVLREPFHPTVVSQAASGAKLPNVPSGVVKTTHNQGSVHYADTAGFAAEAGHAKTADEIGGLTLDQVLQKLGSAQQRGPDTSGSALPGGTEITLAAAEAPPNTTSNAPRGT